jgi:cobalt/nickel transport protein
MLILIAICLLLIVTPLLALRGAEFGGSDDAGSEMVAEITGTEYEPWATPVMEQILGGELPGEMESLLFCVQTGIGVGILAFFLGRFVERKKQEKINGIPDAPSAVHAGHTGR